MVNLETAKCMWHKFYLWVLFINNWFKNIRNTNRVKYIAIVYLTSDWPKEYLGAGGEEVVNILLCQSLKDRIIQSIAAAI